MLSGELRVEATRGDLVESVHRVTVAVVDAGGRLLAAAGDPTLPAWWRSAAKPFQSMALVEDGVAAALGLDDAELALACGSHSSEPEHLAVVRRFLAKAGLSESDLACGTHVPLSPDVARAVTCGAATMTPSWSNCSGKHTGMLALARHHGWPLAGYHVAGHPVQERIIAEVSRWTDVPAADLRLGVDGCTVVCFALPVQAMALAYARLGASADGAPRRLAGAMMAQPMMVAGTGRLCTDLMTAWPGRIVAKVGADGIYCATLPTLGIGVALKVEDGDGRSSGLALLEVLDHALSRLSPGHAAELRAVMPVQHGHQPIRNTRNVVTGELRAAGRLRFLDA
jgi:L-asparaginase II